MSTIAALAVTIITVLTVPGNPSFTAPEGAIAQDIDRIVSSRFGEQPDGRRHNWRGDSTDPAIRDLAASNTRRAVGLPDTATEAEVRAAYDRLAEENTDRISRELGR